MGCVQSGSLPMGPKMSMELSVLRATHLCLSWATVLFQSVFD